MAASYCILRWAHNEVTWSRFCTVWQISNEAVKCKSSLLASPWPATMVANHCTQQWQQFIISNFLLPCLTAPKASITGMRADYKPQNSPTLHSLPSHLPTKENTTFRECAWREITPWIPLCLPQAKLLVQFPWEKPLDPFRCAVNLPPAYFKLLKGKAFNPICGVLVCVCVRVCVCVCTCETESFLWYKYLWTF